MSEAVEFGKQWATWDEPSLINYCDRLSGEAPQDKFIYSSSICFWSEFAPAGAITYSLSHSTAALLAATKSTAVPWAELPHSQFLIQVPAEFVGMAPGRSVSIGLDSVARIVLVFVDSWISSYAILETDETLHEERAGLLAARIAANVVRYISQYRESCTREKRSTKAYGLKIDVRLPSEVTVSREFRAAVIKMIGAKTFAERRAALAHVVRGHWRNQAVGTDRVERRLTWVRPHQRGNSEMGRIIASTVKVSEVIT